MPAHPPLPIAYRRATRQRGRVRLGPLLAILVLASSAVGAWWLISQPPRIERRPPAEAPAPLVDTVLAQRQAAAPELNAFGRVIAERDARLASRVAGEPGEFTPPALAGTVPGRTS